MLASHADVRTNGNLPAASQRVWCGGTDWRSSIVVTDQAVVIAPQALDILLQALQADGYSVVGPTVRDGVIAYDELRSSADLPVGWTDEQQPGRYRLRQRDDGALFGYAVGPHSWKQFLHPPRLRLWRAEKSEGSFTVHADEAPPPKFAFLGVRACELHAIAIQDRVFFGGQFKNPDYQQRREAAFVIAVNCGEAGGTCFCVSMNTGPAVRKDFDLALTELLDADRHELLVEIGSERGAKVMASVASRAALAADREAGEAVVANTAAHMGRHLNTEHLKEALQLQPEHPRWQEVADRCLACTNCTLVCPTCFCTSVEDTSQLAGNVAERWQRWDSCFTMDFSHLHGGSVRTSHRARYRQWATHKLAHWIDQFGTSGCVGCGRCISWCPVGIDLTAEANAIRDDYAKREVP